MLTTMSFAALFAGAAMAAEQPTITLESIENVESFDVASGEYVQASGAYYRDGGLPGGKIHKGPVVNVGSMSIDGTFEVKASDQDANRLFDVKNVSGAGEIRFGRGVYISQESNFSNFSGTLTLFTAVNDQGNRKGSGAYFLSGTNNNPSNIKAFNLEENTELSFTNGDYTLTGKIEGAGTISARTLGNLNFEGDKILENAAPANVVIKSDISNFSGSYVARESSSIKLETKLADKVVFVGDTGGTLELAGAAGDARKTITINSSSDTTTSGNVFMYGNKAIIANNSRAGGAVDANSGAIYFGGNHEYTQADLVNHTFDKNTVIGDSAGNVVMGGKGAGASTAKGISAKVDGVKIGTLVIGGADGATVDGNTQVIVNSGEIGAIYGGMGGIHNGATTIEVNGGKVGNIYGADGVGGTVNGNIYIHVKDANVEQLFGSNYAYNNADETKFGGVTGNVSIIVDGNSKVGQIRGGINTSAQESEAIAKEKMVLDGNVNVNVKGNAVVGEGSVAIIGGGGSYGSVKEYVSINISENATVNGDVFAGANSVESDSSENLPYVGTNTYLSVNDNATVDGNLFGGSRRNGVVKNNTSVSVNGGTVNGNVYGGGQQGSTVEGMSMVRANGGVINGDIYGGGKNGGEASTTSIRIYEGATVAGNVYGGGDNGTVNGNTQIEIYGNSDIKGDIYGGGKGADSKVLGNSSIRFVSNSNFTGTVDGAGQDGGTVAGTRRLTFGGWQEGKKWDGDFKGKIKNINEVVLTNGSNVSNLRFDMTEPMSFGGEGTLEVITNLVDKNIDSMCLVNVLGSAPLDITFRDSKFSGNEINNNSYGVFLHWGAGKMAFDGTTIEDNSITRNDGEQIQGILYYNGSGSGEVVNTVLKNNTVSATQVQSSGVFAYKQDLDISGSQFIGNKSIGSDGSKLTNGAVYVENQSDTAKIVNISDTLFDGNSAENTGEASMGKGGALAVVKRFKEGETRGKGVEVVLNDAAFTNNSAGMGGAIYVGGETLTLNATKSATFSGNTATNGGFLYMDNGEAGSTASAKVSLNVADGATLTIGTTGGASDSIAGVESATLSKLGAGSLNVNGSMADFKGSLIVSAGVMNANNGIGAKSVSIANGATLGVALGNGALESASVENNGTLSLKRGTLADGATFKLSNYSGEGAVKAYGGILSGGTTFTAGKSESFVSSAITVGTGENDVQTVKFGDKLALDFDVAGLGESALTVNAIKESTDLNGIAGSVLAAYDVDLTDNSNDYTVVFSAYVGEIEAADALVAWHKGKDGVWTRLDTSIDYADEIASIVVDGFGSYAFSQVPEPATYAAIFGALALAFAAYRRRK